MRPFTAVALSCILPTVSTGSCDEIHCDAGAECGICLQALANNDEQCPAGWMSDWRLHTCNEVAPGELCEADGECGTIELDNVRWRQLSNACLLPENG